MLIYSQNCIQLDRQSERNNTLTYLQICLVVQLPTRMPAHSFINYISLIKSLHITVIYFKLLYLGHNMHSGFNMLFYRDNAISASHDRPDHEVAGL